jgi:hypothetical protein
MPAPPEFDGPVIESRRKQDRPHTMLLYLDPTHDYLPRKLLAYHYAGRFDPNKPHVELEVLEYFKRGNGPAPPTTETIRTITEVRVPDSRCSCPPGR